MAAGEGGTGNNNSRKKNVNCCGCFMVKARVVSRSKSYFWFSGLSFPPKLSSGCVTIYFLCQTGF